MSSKRYLDIILENQQQIYDKLVEIETWMVNVKHEVGLLDTHYNDNLKGLLEMLSRIHLAGIESLGFYGLEDKKYTLKETANVLKIGYHHLRYLFMSGQIEAPCIDKNHKRYYTYEQLLKLIPIVVKELKRGKSKTK